MNHASHPKMANIRETAQVSVQYKKTDVYIYGWICILLYAYIWHPQQTWEEKFDACTE